MANIKSAVKRIQIIKRNTLQNKQYSSTVKTFIKKYRYFLDIYKKNPSELNLQIAKKNLDIVYSKIDKATKANVLHKNTAARKKSALKIALDRSN